MIEVEVKAHIKSFNDIKLKLNEIKAIKSDKEYQIDTYFNNINFRDFEKTDEALRIRKTTINDSESKIILTYKSAKIDNISKTRKEIEVNIEDFDNMSLILENLGFKAVANVEKHRTTYLIKDYIISLDQVHNVGSFVEIEKTIQEGENYESELDEIFNLFKQLGIDDNFVRKSYLEMMGIYKD